MKEFLSAEWRNLVNLTYGVPPELIAPHVPAGVDLDVYQGLAPVSFVAFDFINTRVKGIRVPGHVNFPEVNLRYYVSHKGRRGVAFIREYVPKVCISLIAQRLYNEPYRTISMASDVNKSESGTVFLEHTLTKGGRDHTLKVIAENTLSTPPADSPEHYFKEHDLGFGVNHQGETLYYLVEHPVWQVRPLRSVELNVDFGILYGEKWAVLNDMKPRWSLFAEGSAIKVFSPGGLSELDAE